jgi:long-chain acyl-CoA synthetase
MSTATISSIGDIVRTHGAGRPQHTCLIEGTRELTWAEMYENSQRVANGLAAAGVKAEDRVALLDMNGVPHFEVCFGAALINAVSVDVNWRLAAPEVEYIVNNAEAKVLVCGAEFVGILDAIVFGDFDQSADQSQGEIAKAEIPSWLKGLVPSGILDEEQPPTKSKPED